MDTSSLALKRFEVVTANRHPAPRWLVYHHRRGTLNLATATGKATLTASGNGWRALAVM
jgi:hypothetical protein